MRELAWMADGRGRLEWSQTSWILAMMFNQHRDPKKTKPAGPDDFNPYAARKKRVTIDMPLASLLPILAKR
jgi:hypothetical protein